MHYHIANRLNLRALPGLYGCQRLCLLMGCVLFLWACALASSPVAACSTNVAGLKCSADNSAASAPAKKASAKKNSRAGSPETILSDLLSRPHMAVAVTVADARHLLERAGIGAARHEIAMLVGKTRAEAVQQILSGYKTRSQNMPEGWMLATAPPHWANGDMLNSERNAFEMARDAEIGALRTWWIKEMISTSSPQTERLVLFWHNHFVSTYDGIDNSAVIMLARQNMKLRELAAGNFRDLVKMIVKDPAMLDYLDNVRNRKESPNENLARELMELFTLGEGQYDEKTVKEAARALTGFRFEQAHDFTFTFNDWSHDKGRKKLFGRTGRFDGDDLVDILLDQPVAAEFIAGKFWRYFVSGIEDNPEQITAIADAFRASDYDIKVLMGATLSSEGFWSDRYRATLFKSPIDLLVGTIRSTGYLPKNWNSIPATTRNLGQQLFGQPNVAGWPGGASWVTPAHLLNRWQAVEVMTKIQPATPMMMLANNNMANSMAGNNMANNMDMAAGDMAAGRYADISLAAENYNGPPRWSLTLFKEKKAVWTSDIYAVEGGHDTVLFGRLDQADMSWDQVRLPIDYDGPFDSISLRFLNDAAGTDGDRNLFINGVRLDGDLYPASLGKQRTNCGGNERPGAMFCAGALILSEKITQAAPELRPADKDDTLYIGKVRMKHMTEAPGQASDRNNVDMDIGLQSVRFNGREMDNVIVRYAKRKNEGVTLELRASDCYPACLTRWPSTAWGQESRSDYVNLDLRIVVPLNGELRHNDHYTRLTPEDRKFVAALWAAMPEFLKRASKGRQARENPKRMQGWEDWADSLSGRLAKSKFVRTNANPPVFEGLGKSAGGMMMMSGGDQGLPFPAGQTPLSGWDEYHLPEALSDTALADWLLATQPTQISIDDNQDMDITMLLSDPVFQLK